MIIGYMCTDLGDARDVRFEQMEKLLETGLLPEDIFEDVTTTYSRQPQLRACLHSLKAGDTLIVWRLTCLARNLTNLVPTIRIVLAKGVTIRALTGASNGGPVQISTANKIMDLVTTLTLFERDRVRRARASRPKAVRARGRPLRITWEQVCDAARAVKTGRATRSAISKQLGISGSTLIKYVTTQGDLTPLAHALNKHLSVKPAQDFGAGATHDRLLDSLIATGRYEHL